jgi:outer membrane lipoprotein-sorting protein
MSCARLAALALLLLAAAPLRAEDAREALIHSIEQESRVSFAGLQTTVVTDRGKSRSAKELVMRQAPDKLRIEYLAPARQREVLVIDDGRRLRHYIPSLKVIEEGPSRVRRTLQRQQARIRALRAGKGNIALAGETMLLGRPVVIVAITPANPARPQRTLWLDRATGVALQIEDQSHGGRTSVTHFLRIAFNPILGPAEFQLPIPRGVTVVPESMGRPISVQRAEQVARRLWGGIPQPSTLPPGYALTSAHQLRFRKKPVIALRYTRGRDDLSLFVSANAGEPFAAPMPHGVNVVQRPIGKILVTLVGSLPPAELERIAGSLRPPNAPSASPPPLANRRPSR